jgi:hypothetical protein
MIRTALLILLWPGVLLAQAAETPADDDPFGDAAWDDWAEDSTAPRYTGFVEGALGLRTGTDPALDESLTLGEGRARIEAEWRPGSVVLAAKADLGYDAVVHEAIADFRELTLALSPGSGTDIRIGRQVQTWGVGDLVFINDLFPKDYVSFFSGRDDEYLKAPANSVRVSHFGESLNADLVWTPRFEPDVYLTGERFSFYSPAAGGNVAPDPPFDAVEPTGGLGNGEFALRLFRSVNGTELAAYFYRGFFKQPTAVRNDGRAGFAPLNAYGASIRRPWGPGLVSSEFAWYDSRDDSDGSNPNLPNSQLRFLAGYEWEARPNFTVGLQYYVERTLDHDALIDNSPWPGVEPDEYRHLLTNRLTWRLARDRYTLSLFTFFSPSDSDAYLRPSFTYRRDDHWQWVAGANLFGGQDPHTFFNQLQDASNVYLRLRYNY